MSAAERYPYRMADPAEGAASLSPYLPLTLSLGSNRVSVSGLVDSGAAINVLPFDVGVQLGAVWEQQAMPVRLTGNLAAAEARGLVVIANVGQFPPVRLAFAWTQARTIPVILGQVNFFLEFDVCFFRSGSVFEIQPRRSGSV
jgi:hypothetical protein